MFNCEALQCTVPPSVFTLKRVVGGGGGKEKRNTEAVEKVAA